MKILVITNDPGTRLSVDTCLSGMREMLVGLNVEHLNPDKAAVSAYLESHRPQLVIMESAADGSDLSSIDPWVARYPLIAFVLLSRNSSPEYLLKAMQAGVRELLPLPLVPVALKEAVQRLWQRIDPAQHPTDKGRLLAFLPCKGGSGATFLATNLAYILAKKEGKRVALLDFNLQYGDAVLFVSDQHPQSTLADVSREIGRLDSSLLASSMVHIMPGFDLLAAPDDPEHSLDVQSSHVDRLLTVARGAYDVVIVDMSRFLSSVTVRILDEADVIFPVLQQTLPFIRDAKRMMTTFHGLGYKTEKIHPLINRYGKGGSISLEDVERTLGVKIFRTIPNSFVAVADSVNQGIPIAKLDIDNPVSKALTDMAHELIHGNQQAKAGWLKQILHGGG